MKDFPWLKNDYYIFNVDMSCHIILIILLKRLHNELNEIITWEWGDFNISPHFFYAKKPDGCFPKLLDNME